MSHGREKESHPYIEHGEIAPGERGGEVPRVHKQADKRIRPVEQYPSEALSPEEMLLRKERIAELRRRLNEVSMIAAERDNILHELESLHALDEGEEYELRPRKNVLGKGRGKVVQPRRLGDEVQLSDGTVKPASEYQRRLDDAWIPTPEDVRTLATAGLRDDDCWLNEHPHDVHEPSGGHAVSDKELRPPRVSARELRKWVRREKGVRSHGRHGRKTTVEKGGASIRRSLIVRESASEKPAENVVGTASDDSETVNGNAVG